MRVEPKKWDKAHNFDLLARYARDAGKQGADLLVTSEGFLDGYTANIAHTPELTREKFLAIGEPLDGPWMQRIGNLAAALKIHLAVCFAERRGELMFNSMAIYSPEGTVILHYSKVHPTSEPFSTPGNRIPVARAKIGTLGTLICFDRKFPEVARILALKGAQIVMIPGHGVDGKRNEALLQTRAWENSVWVVYVKPNQVLIIKPNGRIAARDSGKGDELVFGRIELNDDVGGGDLLHRRPPEVYRELIQLEPARKNDR